MDDPFEVLDCALRSRYLIPTALPTLPIWDRLPGELRTALAVALAAGKPLATLVPLVWQIRAKLHGKRVTTGEGTRAYVALRLGMLYLAHREGLLDHAELFSRAFHVADSYVCDVDARPFLWLRDELAAGRPEEGQMAALFAPYTGPAEMCIEQWGLNRRQ